VASVPDQATVKLALTRSPAGCSPRARCHGVQDDFRVRGTCTDVSVGVGGTARTRSGAASAPLKVNGRSCVCTQAARRARVLREPHVDHRAVIGRGDGNGRRCGPVLLTTVDNIEPVGGVVSSTWVHAQTPGSSDRAGHCRVVTGPHPEAVVMAGRTGKCLLQQVRGRPARSTSRVWGRRRVRRTIVPDLEVVARRCRSHRPKPIQLTTKLGEDWRRPMERAPRSEDVSSNDRSRDYGARIPAASRNRA